MRSQSSEVKLQYMEMKNYALMGIDSEQLSEDFTDYSVPNTTRPSGKIQSRMDAYHRLKDDKTTSIEELQGYINEHSSVMLKETTSRGQSLVLECVRRFCEKADLTILPSHKQLILDILDSYGAIPSNCVSISGIFECLEIRNLSKIAGDVLIESISRLARSLYQSHSSTQITPRTSVSKNGSHSKQFIGCVGISRLLVERIPNFHSRISKIKLDFARVISVSAFDRPLREACYSILSLIITDVSELPSLALEQAQERELRSRLHTKLNQSVDSTLLIHPSNPSSSQDCPVTTPSSNSPRHMGVGKEWITRILESSKWQEKRDRLVQLRESITSQNPVIASDDFMIDFVRVFKEESNAPVLVAYLELVNSFASSSSRPDPRWLRNLLFVSVTKIREKNPSVTRALKSAVICILKSRSDFFDSRFVHHLAEVSKAGRKDVLSLILDIVHYITSVPVRVDVIQAIICPALDNGETLVRDLAVAVTKRIIADTASDQPGELENVLQVFENSSASLPPARKKAIYETLGLAEAARKPPNARKSPSRPGSISPGSPSGDANVSHLIRALVQGHSLVQPCVRIKETLEKGVVDDKRLIEAIAKSVKPVLIGEDADSRHAVLALLHTATRSTKVWETAQVRDVRIFLDEMLRIVDDKLLRQTEPEIWSDINLSVVHAISNCERATAYSALIEVSGTDLPSSVGSLAIKCIEKLNKALPQYFEVADPSRAETALWSILDSVLPYTRNESHRNGWQTSLQGICTSVHAVSLGEYLGARIVDPDQRRFYKKIFTQLLPNP